MSGYEWLKIQKHKEDKHCVFSGTVTFDDGMTVEVTLPLAESQAEDFVAISTELTLKRERDDSRARGAAGFQVPSDDVQQEFEEMNRRLQKAEDAMDQQRRLAEAEAQRRAAGSGSLGGLLGSQAPAPQNPQPLTDNESLNDAAHKLGKMMSYDYLEKLGKRDRG